MSVTEAVLTNVHKKRKRKSALKPKPTSLFKGILALENGDRLSREEFERRYETMPEIRAELIEGVVYMGSPIRIDHSWAQGQILGWLSNYCAGTPGVKMGGNATVRLDVDNEVEPDALLMIVAKEKGQTHITEKLYVEGAPELIVEIAASSVSYDLHLKKHVYRRNGVREYLVWRVYDGELDWFHLDQGEYAFLEPDAEGIIKSQVFSGLDLNVPALLSGDLQQVFETVQTGLQSKEHARFAQTLQ